MSELLAGLTLYTGVTARQGCRRTMEDQHTVLQHVDPSTEPEPEPEPASPSFPRSPLFSKVDANQQQPEQKKNAQEKDAFPSDLAEASKSTDRSESESNNAKAKRPPQLKGRFSRQASLFAVYDGHGGGETSVFLRDRFHAALIEVCVVVCALWSRERLVLFCFVLVVTTSQVHHPPPSQSVT
jgi:hypothetical protein